MFDLSRIDDISIIADQVLEQINVIFSEAGHALPGRQYITTGSPAFDCEQLTVSFMNIESGLPDQAPRPGVPCNDPSTGTFLIDLVRKGPQGTGRPNSSIVPPPDKLSDFGRVQMRDAKLLSDACHSIISTHFISMGSFTITLQTGEGLHQAVTAELRIPI